MTTTTTDARATQMRDADRPLEHRIAAAIGRLARGDRRARIPDDATVIRASPDALAFIGLPEEPAR